MRRVASHFVFWKGLYRMHYVELSDDSSLIGVYPLVEEIAGTEFYDGIIFPVVYCENTAAFGQKILFQKCDNPNTLRERAVEAVLSSYHLKLAELGEKVTLLDLHLSASELGTDDSCCYGNIQRL